MTMKISMPISRRAALAAAPAVLALAAGPALADSDAQNLVDEARITLDDLRHDKEFGNARDLLHRAQAVMIVPGLVKGGFIFGGEGGDAVLLRRGGGGWSLPAFYTLASASFGFQIGIEKAELVVLVMTERASRAFLNDEFKLGAQAGLAVATLGATAEAAASGNGAPDIIVWSSATGAYAGLTLNGSVIKPRESFNRSYYGQALSPDQIMSGAGKNPGADRLRRTLAELG